MNHEIADSGRKSALVLGGGVGLGAFAAGAYEELEAAGLARSLDWVAGSSIGAVTAAIIAGSAPADRLARLNGFWSRAATDPTPLASFWLGRPRDGLWRQVYNMASVAETFVFGRTGLFRPRLLPGPRAGVDDVPSVFDLAPLGEQLSTMVDFERLNRGDVRVSLAATDVVSGERVVFDTGRGCTIGPNHVLASCALLPLFAPVEVEGRLLADGGLASNAPLDLITTDPAATSIRCFVVDLFDAQGSRPHTLAAGASRATDLAFGNQSRRLLEAQDREDNLRRIIGRLGEILPDEARADPEIARMLAEGQSKDIEIIYLGYRAGLDEAGLGKPFDFSRVTLGDRWKAGQEAMRAKLHPQLASAI